MNHKYNLKSDQESKPCIPKSQRIFGIGTYILFFVSAYLKSTARFKGNVIHAWVWVVWMELLKNAYNLVTYLYICAASCLYFFLVLLPSLIIHITTSGTSLFLIAYYYTCSHVAGISAYLLDICTTYENFLANTVLNFVFLTFAWFLLRFTCIPSLSSFSEFWFFFFWLFF